MSTSFDGLVAVLLSVAAAAAAVLVWRRFDTHETLESDATFVENTYPIIGLIYGVFLGFTIVIAWGHFRDAETSTVQEVTRLSELWRDVELLPEPFRGELRCELHGYAREVVATDWTFMAESGGHSPEATEAYEDIWRTFYRFEPDSLGIAQAAFYGEALAQLNELGRERRRRGLFAGAEVQPMVRALLIGGGVFVVLFSLLLPVRSLRIQITVTALISGLITSSIVLALALERPFAGDLSVAPTAFEDIAASFEHRAGGNPCRAGPPGSDGDG